MPATRQPPPDAPKLSLLSIVIPARDEEGCIAETAQQLHDELQTAGVPHEIIVVDDGSTVHTWEILTGLASRLPALQPRQN